MSEHTSIEWTDATWNPVRGCSKISPGCKNCYAEAFAERFRGVPGHPYEQGFDLRMVPDKLMEPFGWAQPRRVFVNSMSDLLHESLPNSWISRVLDVMQAADWHLYQVLTKRASRLHKLPQNTGDHPHIWWGVSVEDKTYGLPRIDVLRAAPVAIRFLSIEPLLEDLGTIDLAGIDWVIVGGESGLGARPMHTDWVRSIRDQCQSAGVPFFFKQWGGLRKRVAGRLLDGVEWNEMPQFQFRPAPQKTEREVRLHALEAYYGWLS